MFYFKSFSAFDGSVTRGAETNEALTSFTELEQTSKLSPTRRPPEWSYERFSLKKVSSVESKKRGEKCWTRTSYSF